jgi:16S rRNA C967 or C1407 C5-methylase (RsmB/RsmF family)
MTPIDRFIETYRPQYGEETEQLIEALINHDDKVALINPYIEEKFLEKWLSFPSETILGQRITHLPKSARPESINGMMSHYFLDRSSLLAPLLLPLAPAMKVLDMCSAPGGKLLVMIYRNIKNLSFVANDLSAARGNRLRKVVLDYVPHDLTPSFAAKDASLIGLKQAAHYDAVLLDAPCSSEAHVLKDPLLMSQFKGLRKTLTHRQYSLLCSAVLATKKGGTIMYATCSINKNENEEIIKKLIKKKGDQVEIVPLDSPLGQSSPWGVSVLPHLHQAGPAFFSLLKKL